MRARRILILGATGVDKVNAADRLCSALNTRIGGSPQEEYKVVDFERDYLAKKMPFSTFLDNSPKIQWKTWLEAWTKMNDEEDFDNKILLMHGCYVRRHYGLRLASRPGLVAEEFKPDIIFNLSRDVYDMQWKTDKLAEEATGEPSTGRPTLEQLMLARRAELAYGDQVAAATPLANDDQVAAATPNEGEYVRNLMLSVYHPLEMFVDAVMHFKTIKVGYLAFAISQPVALKEKHDDVPFKAVSDFVKEAFKARPPELVLECPLMIDEIPLARKIPGRKARETRKKRRSRDSQFDRDKARWPLHLLVDPQKVLVPPPEPGGSFNVGQLDDVEGAIWTDVGWRDYRLVDQADVLYVFNPVWRSREKMARSVLNEIIYALDSPKKKTVWFFQDKDQDKKGALSNVLNLGEATLPPPPSHENLVDCGSLATLLSHIASGE